MEHDFDAPVRSGSVEEVIDGFKYVVPALGLCSD